MNLRQAKSGFQSVNDQLKLWIPGLNVESNVDRDGHPLPLPKLMFRANEHHGHQKKTRTQQHVCPVGKPCISGPFRANPNLRAEGLWPASPAWNALVVASRGCEEKSDHLTSEESRKYGGSFSKGHDTTKNITSQKMVNLRYPAKRHVSS